jgi:HlyD family secretion protein
MKQTKISHCLSISLGLSALIALPGCPQDAPIRQNKGASKRVPVKTVSVVQGDFERVTVQPATIHPFYSAEIWARTSGYVAELRADIGDVVKKGAVLAVIDAPEMLKQREILEARLGRYQAEEESAEAGIDLADADVRSAEARFVQAQSQMHSANASLTAAEAEFERTRDLVQRKSLESRVLDEVRKRRDSSLANRESVTSAVKSADADIAVAKAKLAAATADLQAAKADTTIAKKQLDELDVLIQYTSLKAPFDDIVTERSIDPGDLVRDGNTEQSGPPLFVLNQVNKVRIHVAVPESDAALVNRGDSLALSFPFFRGETTIDATVTRVSGSLDPSTRTMLVEAEIGNTDGKLIPGMFGQATINLSAKVAANTLPSRAIRFDESGKAYVYAVDDDETVSVIDVSTGLDDGLSIEILSGVEPGQRVIDNHLKRFTTGQKVRLLSNDPPG